MAPELSSSLCQLCKNLTKVCWVESVFLNPINVCEEMNPYSTLAD